LIIKDENEQMHTIDELLKLKSKTAFITGAALGIGRGIALRLHEAGANVVLVDSNESAVHAFSDELHGIRSGSSYVVCADVSAPLLRSPQSTSVSRAVPPFVEEKINPTLIESPSKLR
jgi:NAD(P)-dependent dehydrogenase (short-subunit alcohol dehydrogenase family)